MILGILITVHFYDMQSSRDGLGTGVGTYFEPDCLCNQSKGVR